MQNKVEHKGKFWIQDNENDKFDAILSVANDNFTYLTFSLPLKFYKVYNFLIDSNLFTIYGILENGKYATIKNAFVKRQQGNDFIIRGDILLIGNTVNYNDENLKEISATYTGFATRLNSSIQQSKQKNSEFSMYFYQQDNHKKDCYSDIKVFFSKSKDFDSALDLVSSINNFFTLIKNYPSNILNLNIKTETDENFQVNLNWLPNRTRNKINFVKTKCCGLNNLQEKLIKWIDFSKKAQIAMEQYFALQSLNKTFYEQMILYTSIFALEGFINAYNQDNVNDKTLISKSVHKELCKKKINPFIDKLKDSSEKDLPDYYKKSLKNAFSYAYEKTFAIRLTEFFDRNKNYFEKDFQKLEISQDDFTRQIVQFRNTYAHNSDENLAKLKGIKSLYLYSSIINKAIRILLLKDVLVFEDLSFSD